MPDTGLRNTLLDEFLSFDRAKHWKGQQTKTKTDTFLVKSRLCHNLYNRYVTPQVGLECSEAVVRCTCSDASAPDAEAANTSNAPTDISFRSITSGSTTPPHSQPSAPTSVSTSSFENPTFSLPLPSTWPWRDPEDDRVNGLKPYTIPQSRRNHDPLDTHEEFIDGLVELVENGSVLLGLQYHSKVSRHAAMARSLVIELRLRE